MGKWFVLITGINQEFLAQKHLSIAGYLTYCPIGRKIVSHARRKEMRIFPVFSRYLFIKPNEDGFDAIHEVKGIIGIIRDDDGPIGIQQPIIESLMDREKNGDFDILPPPTIKKHSWQRSFTALKQLLHNA